MIPVLNLGGPQADKFRRLLERAPKKYPSMNVHELNEWLSSAVVAITQEIRSWYLDVRDEEWGLIRGLPVRKEAPPTPRLRDEASRCMDVEDLICGVVLKCFGELLQYAGKVDPSLIQNVFYVPGHEDLQLGSGVQKLEWHVEDGFHAFRPDWVGLLCVRGDRGTRTYLARSQDLPDDEIRADMLETRFRLRVDDSFSSPYRDKTIQSCTLIAQASGYDIVFDPDFTLVGSETERQKLDSFSRAFDEISKEVTLKAGDMLVFNNRRVVHGRSPYLPKTAGKDRWLKRGLSISSRVYQKHALDGRLPFKLI